MPNTPWNHSHLSQVLPFLYFANTASSEPRSHTKNNSVLNPTRLARSPLPWLGTLGFRLNRSRTRLPPPEASRPRGGKEGSGWPFSALPRPSHFGGESSASPLISLGKCLQPAAFPQPGAGWVGAARVCPQPRAGSPHPPPAGTQSGGRARAHTNSPSLPGSDPWAQSAGSALVTLT